MKGKVFWLFIGCLVAFPQTGMAQVQTIRKEVRQIFGGSQSPDDARIGAITRAKREALEEAGTYLESLTIVREHQVAKDEILALSSGVLRATVIEEENFVEGSAFGIRVVAEVQVDRSTLEERVRKLLADREHLEKLRAAGKRELELLERLAALEAENARLSSGATAGQRETLKEQFAESTAKLTAQEWFNMGLILWNGNGYDPAEGAVRWFSEALRLDSGLAPAYDNRGLAYNDLGQYQRAIEDYNQALRLDPDDAVAYNGRGNVYYNRGQYRRAIEDYDQALRLDPDLAAAYSNRGRAYDGLEQYRRAIEDYDRTLRLDTDFAIAYGNRGATYCKLGQYRRAIKDFDQAIRLDPDNAKAYTARGVTYGVLGQYKRAIEDYDQALRLDRDHTSAYTNRGIAYFDLGQYLRTIEDYDQVIRLKPDYADAYHIRGLAYNNLGQRAKALQDWRKACELGYQPACELVK